MRRRGGAKVSGRAGLGLISVRGGPTLNAYLQAIGGTARMIVRFSDGHEATLNLAELA